MDRVLLVDDDVQLCKLLAERLATEGYTIETVHDGPRGLERALSSKVQEIADNEAATIARLLVEKKRLQSKIYSTVLTPEQRAKAHELQKRWESRLDRVADRFQTQPTKK
jgi:CheY-like chemotaxis protein